MTRWMAMHYVDIVETSDPLRRDAGDGMRTARVTVAVLLGAAAALSPTPARADVAASIRMEPTGLVYEAAPGQQNWITIQEADQAPGQLITDGYPINIGAGVPCRYQGTSMTAVSCDISTPAGAVRMFRLGDGNDVFSGPPSVHVPYTVHGGSGDDFIAEAWLLLGEDGRDTLAGGAGDDSLIGGEGADLIYGGAGSDVARFPGTDPRGVVVDADGQPGDDGRQGEGDTVATDVEGLEGSAGADHLFGTDGDNVLLGGDGDDTMHGFAGNDRIDPGRGADTVYAGAGDDWVSGSDGDSARNLLIGGDGKDALSGDRGGDYLDGGAGDDRLGGGGGNDELFAGPGNDLTFAGEGDDSYAGGAGDDRFEGEDGNDVAHGDAGNDHLKGGPGQDLLYGDAGDDDLLGGHSTWELDRLDGGPHSAGDRCRIGFKVACER